MILFNKITLRILSMKIQKEDKLSKQLYLE